MVNATPSGFALKCILYTLAYYLPYITERLFIIEMHSINPIPIKLNGMVEYGAPQP